MAGRGKILTYYEDSSLQLPIQSCKLVSGRLKKWQMATFFIN